MTYRRLHTIRLDDPDPKALFFEAALSRLFTDINVLIYFPPVGGNYVVD